MTYIYTYVRHEDEHELCRLEMRALFGSDARGPILRTDRYVPPSRSPFMRGVIHQVVEADSYEALLERVAEWEAPPNETVKIVSVNDVAYDEEPKWSHTHRRKIEREVGLAYNKAIDLVNPTIEFALLYYDGRWYGGPYEKGEAVWLHHQQKPHSYSTALSTRVARAVVNIAVPTIDEVERVIDPCCGIGTVVVEALSMNVPIEASDVNPLVCQGTRENIAHFGYEGLVTKRSIQQVNETYDVAIIDMPYNLFTHITEEEAYDIIRSARVIANRLVVVTIEPMDDVLREVGWTIEDRAIARKGTFERHVLICT